MKSAIFVHDSANHKIAGRMRVSATYASVEATCPRSCPLKDNGCYAQTGHVFFAENRIAKKQTPEQAARAEARAIDASFDGGRIDGRALRVHVSGDARTPRAARILGDALERWRARGGGVAWSYTHAWPRVARKNWGGAASVLASIETTSDGTAALARGYAPAVVVAEHPADGRAFERDGVTWIPCPQQTRDVPCTDCRLCWDADRLHSSNSGIAFAAHGSQAKRVRLKVLKA